MSYKIAITGKGGVGKTTVAGLLINRLIQQKKTPILAVDADPNTCLDRVLGVSVKNSIGSVREETRKLSTSSELKGIAKQEFLELKIAESLVESEHFDLIAMGRPEGAGCYCYANNVLKDVILKLSNQYPYIVIDNEAGLENLSRRIVQKVDLLIIVADPSKRGLDTLNRLYDLANEMKIEFDKVAIVINRLRGSEIPQYVLEIKDRINAAVIVGIPDDEELAVFAENNENLLELPESNKVLSIIENLINFD